MTEIYEWLVQQAPDAMIFADRDGLIRVWNARAESFFGHAAGEAIGKRLDLIIPEHLRAAHWRGFDAALATGHTRLGGKPMLTRAVHKDGGKLYLELAFDVVRDASGAIVGSIATARMASKPRQR